MRKLFALVLLLLSLTIHAQDKGDGFTFAFLADIHLNNTEKAIKGFKKTIDTLNHLKPDFVITGGDLVMDASKVSCAKADSLFMLYDELQGDIEAPLYNCIGNHDNFGLRNSSIKSTHPEFGRGMFEKYFGPSYYSFKKNNWHFIVLNSINRDKNKSHGYDANIDSLQIEWIKEELTGIAPELPIVIITHVPFITVNAQFHNGGQASSGKNGAIRNSKQVLSLFEKHNLKLILQGHTHFLEDLYVNNKYRFISGGSVSAAWWNGATGVGMQEGFLLIEVKNEHIEWDYID